MRSNRIICVVAALVAFAAFVATNSPEAFGLLVLVVCLPLGSVAAGGVQAACTSLDFSLKPSCAVGDELSLVILLTRPRLLRSHVELRFVAENLLLGGGRELPVHLAAEVGEKERFELPLRTDCPGQVRLSLASARVRDMLGLCEFDVPGAALQGGYTVYPALCDLELSVRLAGNHDDSGASYDLDRPGKDRSEVFEMRGFEQGDSLKDVHWKLSARMRELVVRVPSRPGDYDIALLCGAHPVEGDDQAQVGVLAAQFALTASVSLGLLRAGEGHVVVRSAEKGLETLPVESLMDFYEMLDALLVSPLQQKVVRDGASWTAYRLERGITKTVVITDLVNNEMFDKLGAPEDVSVIHVSREMHTGSDESAGRALTHVFVEDVPGRIKALEL